MVEEKISENLSSYLAKNRNKHEFTGFLRKIYEKGNLLWHNVTRTDKTVTEILTFKEKKKKQHSGVINSKSKLLNLFF